MLGVETFTTLATYLLVNKFNIIHFLILADTKYLLQKFLFHFLFLFYSASNIVIVGNIYIYISIVLHFTPICIELFFIYLKYFAAMFYSYKIL